MAAPLKDFRCAINAQCDDALEGYAAMLGVDKQTAARRILADWARAFHRGTSLYAKRRAANGAQLGLDGFDSADDGEGRK